MPHKFIVYGSSVKRHDLFYKISVDKLDVGLLNLKAQLMANSTQIVHYRSIVVIGGDEFLFSLQFLCKFCMEDLAANQRDIVALYL